MESNSVNELEIREFEEHSFQAIEAEAETHCTKCDIYMIEGLLGYCNRDICPCIAEYREDGKSAIFKLIPKEK